MASQSFQFVMRTGPNPGKVFEVSKSEIYIGRDINNDIVINDPKVSGFHARIDRVPEGFVLVDLNSRNGSFVNGSRIKQRTLETGDKLRLGAASLAYKVDYTSST